MDNHLKVAFATDDGYVSYTGIAMLSLFDNNREFEDITIYILDNGISETGKTQLIEIADQFGRHIEFLNCRAIGDWLGNEVLEMFQRENTNVPITSYARLFLPDLLDRNVEKILYLDADSLILGSYFDLWAENIDDYAVMGVLDNVSVMARMQVELPENFPYVNAGVLLMNLKYLRQICFTERVKEFIKKYHGHVYHHDQGIINGLLKEKIGILPPQYNMMSFFFEQTSAEKIKRLYEIPQFYTEQECFFAKKEPVYIHFTEGYLQRPWVKNCKHPLKEEWIRYRNQTVWKSDILLDDKRSFKQKFLAWINLNLPVQVIKALIRFASR